MNELALFAGSGGGILGGHLLGWKTVAACEIEDYPRETLLRRQLDGHLPRFPIWDDINTFDGTQFRGCIDIISGGFPCQDISAAGKGAGIDGIRSGLWKEMHRVIGEVRPQFAFMENSPLLTSRGLGTVLGDLAEIGYNAEWVVLGADDIGAPHRRKRIWILAYTNEGSSRDNGARNGRRETSGAGTEGLQSENRETYSCDSESGSIDVGNTIKTGLERYPRDEYDRNKSRRIGKEEIGSASQAGIQWWDYDPAELPNTDEINGYDRGSGTSQVSQFKEIALSEREYWPTKSFLGRMAHGVANRVDRLKAIGNGQVPAVAAVAFLTLYNRIKEL